MEKRVDPRLEAAALLAGAIVACTLKAHPELDAFAGREDITTEAMAAECGRKILDAWRRGGVHASSSAARARRKRAK